MNVCVKLIRVCDLSDICDPSLQPLESMLEGVNTGNYYCRVSLARSRRTGISKWWKRNSTKALAILLVIGERDPLKFVWVA